MHTIAQSQQTVNGPRHLEFFETDSGRAPVAEYIGKLRKPADRARIVRTFEVVQAVVDLPNGTLKKLKGHANLWEIRVQQHRFMGFFLEGPAVPKVLVLVSAFPKQSNDTPQQEIDVATRRKLAYFQRRGPTK
jgi:phage-related protein